MLQNVHVSLNSRLVITDVAKNLVTKRPHYAEQLLWHHKCGQKSCDKSSTFRQKADWTSQMCQKNHVTKRPHSAEQPAGHQKWVQKSCDKPSKLWFRKGWTWCHRAFWGGWTSCHMWQTIHLEARVDEKYLDGSYRCKNVTGANFQSRWFVGWTDSVGRIVTWSVCGRTDRQGTILYIC